MTTRPEKKNISIQQVLAALMDEKNVFPQAYLQHFSDLEGRDLEAVRSVWPQLSPRRRFTLLEDLEDINELDTLVSFDAIARFALEDPDPRVRTVAIRMLWETDDNRLGEVFMQMLDKDDNSEVRAAAASALGNFIYRGELEEIPEDLFHKIENRLLEAINSQDDTLVRRRALEAMGFSSLKEVPPLIRTAFGSSDTSWVASALFAMGRSADNAWEQDVIRMLRSPSADVQLEAVRAAGSLELARARRALLDMLDEEAQDPDITKAVIWSLSQIGGDEVRDTLEKLLEEIDDDEEAETLQDALDNLSFTEDVGLYGLFDFDQIGQANQEILDLEEYSASHEEDAMDIDSNDDQTESPSSSITDHKKQQHGKSN